MKITSVIYKLYEYKFETPVHLSGVALSSRKGFYLWLQDDRGAFGLGEAAPLPGFSRESLQDVESSLADLREIVESRSLELQVSPQRISGIPELRHFSLSLQYGFEQAVFDLEGKQRGVPVSNLFSDPPAREIKCNGLIDRVEISQIPEIASRLVDAGFSTVKVKLGNPDFQEDLRLLSEVRSALPDACQIRVDVNEAWSFESALMNIKRLEKFRIEYIEQPIPRGHIEHLGELRIQSPIPIAVDEDIRSISDMERVLYFNAADVVVLKPMLMGGMTTVYAAGLKAVRQQVGVVLTSSLDSAIGRSGTIHLAAALTPDTAHGLTAGSLIEPVSIKEQYGIKDGTIRIPNSPGFGWNLQPGKITE